MIRASGLAALVALTLAAAAPATAQQGGPFAPRVIVNDRTVTNYELEQRIRFLTILGAPGEVRDQALDALIEDRLRLSAAEALGIDLTEEQVREGMEEFASRANLSADQFVAALGRAGIAGETFRDFVEAGLAWRQVIRARYVPRSQITEAEIDRAIAMAAERGGDGPSIVSVEYARFLMPGGARAQAEKVRARVDTCDDLFGVALGQPEDRLIREVKKVGEVPAGIAAELARLDEGETSLGLSTPETTVVLMLCGRTPELGEGEIDREAVRRTLLNQRLASYAESYMAELKADAIIRQP